MSPRKLNADDIFQIRLIGDVAVHPDKPKAATVVTRMVEDDNRYESHIWMVSTNSSEAIQFTSSPKSESAPAWSPDGRWLAFLSNRGGDDNQLYIMPDHGGEAMQVTNLPHGVLSFRWRPDGSAIALLSNVPEWAKDDEKALAQANPDYKPHTSPRKKYTEDVRTIDRSFYRLDGTGFFDEKKSHLFVVDVRRFVDRAGTLGTDEASATKGSSPAPFLRLTEGRFSIDSFDWAHDGGSLVVEANIDQDDYEHTFRMHLYRIPAPSLPLVRDEKPLTPAEFVNLTPGLHAAGSPKCSPDGRLVAFRGHNNNPTGAAQVRLYVLEVESGVLTCLTEDVDEWFENRSMTDTRANAVDELTWSMQSDEVYVQVATRGSAQLASVNVRTKEVTYLTKGHHVVLAYSVNRVCDQAVIVLGNTLDPANVYTLELTSDPDLQAPRRLTDWNQEFLESVELSRPEKFTFTSDGVTLDGWVMLPPGQTPAGGWPTLVEVHGGPAMMYSDSFFFEFQLVVASGIAVIYSNPRGSVGYGQDFCACIVADWGNLDFKDVEALADAALARYPLAADNMAIAGGSYGGFMSAWAIGHTKRYKAAVVMRAVINWYSMVGSSDVGFATPFDEFRGAVPWRDTEAYLSHSPIAYVDHVEASTLIIHSEEDYRCPIEQGEQFYTALRIRGVPVEFVRFPKESHGLSRAGKPWHRVLRLEKIQAFLERELQGTKEA